MEEEMIRRRQFLALRVAQRQRGLKPSGHGVGNVRDQLAGAGRDHQVLSPFCLEAILVRRAGRHLAVHYDRQRDLDGRLRRAGRRAVGGSRAVHYVVFGRHAHGLARKLRQLAHREYDGIGQPVLRVQPQLTGADRGVRRDGDLKNRNFGNRGNRRLALHVFQLVADLIDSLLIRCREDNVGRTGRCRFLRSRALVAQLLYLVAQLLGFRSAERLDVLRDSCLDSEAGNIRRAGALQELAADTNLDGRALPASGRIDVSSVRNLRPLLGRQCGC